MNYPCSVIQDLLPLYIDGVCSEESRKVIDEHLAGCTACRQLLDEMQASEQKPNLQADVHAAKVLENIKKRINSRVLRILIGAALAVALVAGSIFILFSQPLKQLGPEDVEMSAEIYDLQALAAASAGLETDEKQTAIFSDPEDDSKLIKVEIPSFGEVTMSEEMIMENPKLSVISMGSKYHLRIVHWDVEDDTLYVSKITTTLLGNEAKDGHEVSVSLHFEGFDRIVYRPEGGGEEVLLWSKAQ